ncbi:MAG: phosphocholine cytidylyltransferase family protein [Proteobacteria bacterium]|nr:phosphocholine cytidylyltransferase family protein [Pseudomonadota bacterium]
MKAIILAAGIGNRLGNSVGDKPKSLMQFNNESLLQRHIKALKENEINDVTLVVGYNADMIKQHLSDSSMNISFIDNPRFKEGSLVSLGCARDILLNETQFILMDADVLYHNDMIKRLVESEHANCFLLDRDFIPGDEPVKLCIDKKNNIIEFRKQIADDLNYEIQGESVGFFKFDNIVGNLLVERIDDYLAKGENDTPYEEAIRDLLLEDPTKFSYEDITGIPWIEIDFPEDIERANNEILPAINKY